MDMMGAIQEVLKRSRKKGKIGCLGCGKATRSRGVFIPKQSEKWGGIKSKQRVMAYGVCPKCAGKMGRDPSGFGVEMEDAILEDIKAHPEYTLQ